MAEGALSSSSVARQWSGKSHCMVGTNRTGSWPAAPRLHPPVRMRLHGIGCGIRKGMQHYAAHPISMTFRSHAHYQHRLWGSHALRSGHAGVDHEPPARKAKKKKQKSACMLKRPRCLSGDPRRSLPTTPGTQAYKRGALPVSWRAVASSSSQLSTSKQYGYACLIISTCLILRTRACDGRDIQVPRIVRRQHAEYATIGSTFGII